MINFDGPITKDKWASVGYVSGRLANQEDINIGQAVFYANSGNEPYDIPLPARAIHTDVDTGQKTDVVIIQAELGPNGVIIGARYFEGGQLIGLLHEFDILADQGRS